MLGFYSIRKLMEAKKLSRSVAGQSLRLLRFRLRPGKRITYLNWHKIDELYDLTAPHEESCKLTFVCNQFVHSYVFILGFSDSGGFDSVLFASDRTRHDGLLLITADQITGIFEAIGRDYPSSGRAVWDEQLGDYRVTND